MNDTQLRADCSRCAALCCVGFSFDRSELFAIDKAAGVACPNLLPNEKCGIHDRLEQDGFLGCVRYDCLGAGQRVTQDVFGGRSWRESPYLAREMFDAFRAMRKVHNLRQLLHSAQKLPLTETLNKTLFDLLGVLEPDIEWTLQSLEDFESGNVPGDVQTFLTSLRKYVGGTGK